MLPLLADGDAVVLRRGGECSVGDIVLFRVSQRDYPGLGREPVLKRRIKLVAAVAGDPAPADLPAPLRDEHDGRVPRGHVAVRGTSNGSEGSSRLGYIQLDRIEGVARPGAIVRIRTQRSERAGAF
jgi:hypothetical protein